MNSDLKASVLCYFRCFILWNVINITLFTIFAPVLYVIVKAPPRVCIENAVLKMQHEGGVSRDSYSTRGSQVLYDSQDTHPSAVFFIHTSIGDALSDILYFLVVWLGEIFCSSRAAANFSDQDISKCLNNLFLVVERTDRISLAVLVNYNVAHVINRARSESYLKDVVIRQSLSVYTIYFIAVERIYRISLAGFSYLQCYLHKCLHNIPLNKFFA